MALRQTDEEQAVFEHALQLVAEQEPLPTEEVDTLSMLDGADLARFSDVFSKLPAGARARLLRALHGAAEQRLRLDFSALNQLALDDVDSQVRLAGVQSTIEDRSSELLRKLLDLVQTDPNAEVRWAAAEDLARFALLGELEGLAPETISQLRAILQAVVRDENQAPRVRGAALAALGYFSDTESAQDLALGFSDAVLRSGAIRGMGNSADSRWTDRLMPVLGSDDPDMRREAARALGEIEDERAATPLVEVVDDPDPEVRLAVIDALGHIGGEAAREALLYLGEDPEDSIRAAAERALEELEAAEGDPMDL
jgi:HEAT repeat protein